MTGGCDRDRHTTRVADFPRRAERSVKRERVVLRDVFSAVSLGIFTDALSPLGATEVGILPFSTPLRANSPVYTELIHLR